jgi:hypothetical protein
VSRTSFCFPQFVDVRHFRIFIVLVAWSCVLWMWVLKFSFGSNVIPSIFGCVMVGTVVLSMVRFSVFLYSAGSGVKSVAVLLDAFSFRLFHCF